MTPCLRVGTTLQQELKLLSVNNYYEYKQYQKLRRSNESYLQIQATSFFPEKVAFEWNKSAVMDSAPRTIVLNNPMSTSFARFILEPSFAEMLIF